MLQSFFGNRFVYEKVRPFVLGGFDYSEVYGWLGNPSDETIVDIGCGFGEALKYLEGFGSYHGFDLDPIALQYLKKSFPQQNVHTYSEYFSDDKAQQIKPSLCVAMGILHHLSDEEVLNLFKVLKQVPTLKRVITLDPVFTPTAIINNIFAKLDRGKYVRTQEQYRQLIEKTAFKVQRLDVSNKCAGRGLVFYNCMLLEPTANQ